MGAAAPHCDQGGTVWRHTTAADLWPIALHDGRRRPAIIVPSLLILEMTMPWRDERHTANTRAFRCRIGTRIQDTEEVVGK